MRKLLSVLSFLFVFCISLACMPSAQAKFSPKTKHDDAGNWYYRVVLNDDDSESDEIWITGYDGKAKNLTIPSEIDGKKVVGLSNVVLSVNWRIESVTIPEGVTEIGENAFWCCYKLKEITIPKGVKVIGEGAFGYCKVLEKVTIPKSVTNIKTGAFRDCKKLESVVLPDGLKELGHGAFYKSGLKKITIPKKAVLSDYVFGGCSKLTQATFKSGRKTISGYGIFYNCKKLKSVKIPKSVKKIDTENLYAKKRKSHAKEGADAYAKKYKKDWTYAEYNIVDNFGQVNNYGTLTIMSYKGKQKNVTIPSTINGKKVTDLGEAAFSGSSIEKVTVPNTFERIDLGAFSNCKSLKEVKLSEGLKTIDEGAFRACTSLNKINIPKSVEVIFDSAFFGCKNLKDVVLPKNLRTIGACAFMGTGIEKITIPPYANIDVGAFSNCENLKEVVFEEGRTGDVNEYGFDVDEYVFENCPALETVKMPEDMVFNISSVDLETCPKLKNIIKGDKTIPIESVTSK